jgi:hypothetical protein
MARSHRHFPLYSFVTGGCQAKWKRSSNRAWRRRVRVRVVTHWWDEDLILPLLREVSDLRGSPNEGIGHYAPWRPLARWWNRIGNGSYFEHYKATRMK